MKITHRILITFFASLSFFVAANIISFFFFASRAYEIFIISQASDQVQKDNNLAKIIQETPLNSHDKAEYKEVFRSLDAISSGISDSTRVLSKSTNESIRSSFSNILLYGFWRDSNMPEAQFIQYVFKRLLIVNLITLTMLGGIVFYLLRRWFKPVQAMNQSLQSIANRQVFLPIQYRIHDEFWPLVHTINTLQETLDRQRLIRSTFLSDVSHELKTPITALKCLIDGIQDGIIPYDAAQLELISHELNRLLIIARKVSGDALDNQSEHLQETNILEVLLRIQIEYSGLLKQNNQTLYISEAPSISLCIQKNFFEQVVHNIFMNFIKYAGSGSTLQVQLEENPQTYLIRFKDNGSGVAAKHIPFLVEKFYQVDQGRSQSKDSKIDRGLGIGMSIIAEFCKLHGASLDIISDTNQGFETSIEFLKK